MYNALSLTLLVYLPFDWPLTSGQHPSSIYCATHIMDAARGSVILCTNYIIILVRPPMSVGRSIGKKVGDVGVWGLAESIYLKYTCTIMCK